MTAANFILDAWLCLLLLVLAVAALRATDPFQGVVVFVAFGLFMALGWARLDAPDLALTEAALGAGVTGALFLAALGRLGEMHRASSPKGRKGLVAALAGLVGLVALLYAALARLGPGAAGSSPDLAGAAYAALPRSGVTNPVTAVILNYRAYDTFLELGVLTLVLLGILALMPRAEHAPGTARPRDTFLSSYAQTLIPLMIVAAGYLLWVGAFRPGGAFQAGSVLAGAGVLFLLARPRLRWRKVGTVQRVLMGGGFALFGVAGLAMMALGGAFLEWPTAWAKWIILAVETAATLSIGFILTALFAACAGRLRRPGTRPKEAGVQP